MEPYLHSPNASLLPLSAPSNPGASPGLHVAFDLSLWSPLIRTSPQPPPPFFFHAKDHFEESRPIVVWSGPSLWTLLAVSSWPQLPLPARWDGANAPTLPQHFCRLATVSAQFDLLLRGTCQISSINKTPSLPSLIL